MSLSVLLNFWKHLEFEKILKSFHKLSLFGCSGVDVSVKEHCNRALETGLCQLSTYLFKICPKFDGKLQQSSGTVGTALSTSTKKIPYPALQSSFHLSAGFFICLLSFIEKTAPMS